MVDYSCVLRVLRTQVGSPHGQTDQLNISGKIQQHCACLGTTTWMEHPASCETHRTDKPIITFRLNRLNTIILGDRSLKPPRQVRILQLLCINSTRNHLSEDGWRDAYGKTPPPGRSASCTRQHRTDKPSIPFWGEVPKNYTPPVHVRHCSGLKPSLLPQVEETVISTSASS